MNVLKILMAMCAVWLFAFPQERLISHVSQTSGGFTPGVIIANLDVLGAHSFTLTPYAQSGLQGERATGTVMPGETMCLTLRELFGAFEVSHFVISDSDGILVTTTYESVHGDGSRVSVHESCAQSAAWGIYPGNWDAVWDGVAVVNVGEGETEITVKRFSSDGSLLAAQSMGSLASRAKKLFVLGSFFDLVPNSHFVVRADEPLAVTAISGSLDNRFLWENRAVELPGLPLLPEGIETLRVDLVAFMEDVVADMPGAESEAYDPPTAEELAHFNLGVSLLLRGELVEAEQHLRTVGYRVVIVTDSASDDDLVLGILPEVGNALFRGTFFVRPRFLSLRDAVFEAPHPKYDIATGVLATRLFCALGARGLAVAGCHRCSNSEISPCDGSTTACNDGTYGPYRISDMAHHAESFFEVFHESALQDCGPASIAVSVHGMASGADDPEFSCSDGTTIDQPDPEYPTNRLATELERLIVDAGSEKPGNGCNLPGDQNLLCGSTNVQGRFANGVAHEDICTTSAWTPSGQFIHIELSRELRTGAGAVGPDLVIRGFDFALPPRGVLAAFN